MIENRKTKAVILPAYNKNLIRAIIGMKIGERDLPVLKAEQVLIKMEAASCNPSDIAFIRGGYNINKPLPAVPGFEGAGAVVDTGSNAKEMLGKRVGSFIQAEVDGTWAEYFISNASDCIVLKNELIKLYHKKESKRKSLDGSVKQCIYNRGY